MHGFIEVKHVALSVLLIAFVSALFLWTRSGFNRYDKHEDIKWNYFPQHRPNISQSKYGQFIEYMFPSVEPGKIIVPKFIVNNYHITNELNRLN